MLIEEFYTQIRSILEEEGELSPHRGMSRGGNDLIKEHVIDLGYVDFIRNFWEVVSASDEVIYAFDVSTRSGQGTLYDDAIIIVHWVRNPDDAENRTLRVGVINYKTDPLTIDPIDWENHFWTDNVQEDWPNYGLRVVPKSR